MCERCNANSETPGWLVLVSQKKFSEKTGPGGKAYEDVHLVPLIADSNFSFPDTAFWVQLASGRRGL